MWWRHKNEISEIMGFVRIFWKNTVQEAYLPKMSISGQIVSSNTGPLEYQPIRAQQNLSQPIRIEYLTHVTYWRHICPYMGMVLHVTP